jgi:steroid delta-isomerase
MTGDIRQSIVERVERYLDSWRTGDLDARRRLFSPKGMLEDPVGTPPLEGGSALAAHWTHIAKEGASYETQLKRVIVAGHEALALALVKTVPAHGPANVTELFALFEFDRALEIRRLRVFRDDSCTHLAS